jgi:hypothetical protein
MGGGSGDTADHGLTVYEGAAPVAALFVLGVGPPLPGRLRLRLSVQQSVVRAVAPKGERNVPSAGLSLVGFMDEQPAIAHLRDACVPANPDPVVLRAEWQAARAKLGAAMANPGVPQILPIVPPDDAYVNNFAANPWAAGALAHLAQLAGGAAIQIALVEIDPLLAYQFAVDKSRSAHHCGNLTPNPPVAELLPLCLPTAPANEEMRVQVIDRAIFISSKCANVNVAFGGWFQNAPLLNPPIPHPVGGVVIGTSLPFSHVTRFAGRCYLHNGFHRALGIRAAGGTHMPCIIRDVPDAAAAGIRPDGTTFNQTLLADPNPPTVGHFTNGRAWDVQLRLHRRVVHIGWAEHMMPVE